MLPRIVGWLLHRDNLCETCRVRAAVYIVTYDGIESFESCTECIPEGFVNDDVAEALYRGLKPQ